MAQGLGPTGIMIGRGLGKVILLGEHAVVYGHPALAGALDRGVTCRAEPAAGGQLSLAIPAWSASMQARADDGGLAGAVAAVARAVGAGEGFAVTAEADIPAGAGLGSSAALSVALARALANAAGRPLSDPAEVERAASAGERIFHGRPSGIDVAIATRGGLGLFRRGVGLASLDAPPIPLVVALSEQARRTAEMVELVADRRRGDPQADRRLERLGIAASEGAEAAARGDAAALGDRMRAAHDELAALGVSTPELDALVEEAMAAGALGAKLTGAGGGGAAIALAPGREDAVLARWRESGVHAFCCRVGGSS